MKKGTLLAIGSLILAGGSFLLGNAEKKEARRQEEEYIDQKFEERFGSKEDSDEE